MHQSTGDRWRLGHRPALDGLRGVAVLLVVAYHAVQSWSLAAGSVGVTIFFTLSGFLVTCKLLEDHECNGRINAGAFYLRRVRRLVPALLALLAVMTIAGLVLGSWYVRVWQIPAVLLYVGNWLPTFGVHTNALSHTWSLGVEEQFYLVAPLTIAVVLRRREVLLLVVAGAGIAASTLLRFILWDGGAGADRIYYGTDTRADALLVGCAVAVLARRGWLPRIPAAVPLSVLGLGVLALSTDRFLLAPTAAAWFTAITIAGIANREGRFLTTGWLTLVGRRSYGLYLWSFPLACLAPVMPGPFWLDSAATVAAAWACALLSWHYVEEPWLHRRHRLAVGPTPLVTAAPSS